MCSFQLQPEAEEGDEGHLELLEPDVKRGKKERVIKVEDYFIICH